MKLLLKVSLNQYWLTQDPKVKGHQIYLMISFLSTVENQMRRLRPTDGIHRYWNLVNVHVEIVLYLVTRPYQTIVFLSKWMKVHLRGYTLSGIRDSDL